jgi:hypothetical protein
MFFAGPTLPLCLAIGHRRVRQCVKKRWTHYTSMAGPVVMSLAVPLRSKSSALTLSALSPSASHSATKQNGHASRCAVTHATASRYGRPS